MLSSAPTMVKAFTKALSLFLVALIAEVPVVVWAGPDSPVPVLDSQTLGAFQGLFKKITRFYDSGTGVELDLYLRSLVNQGIDVPALRLKVLSTLSPADGGVLRVDVAVGENPLLKAKLQDFNQSLKNSGYDFIQLRPGDVKAGSQPKLSKAYFVWMIGRALLIPTAVFIASYVVGIREVRAMETAAGLFERAHTHSELMAPYVAAGVAAGVLSLVFELPRKMWNEVWDSKLGPLFQGTAFLLAPLIVKVAENLAILRPWERDWKPVPYSTALLVPTIVSAVVSVFTLGYSRFNMKRATDRGETSEVSTSILDSLVTLVSDVGRVIFLVGQKPWLGLGIQGGLLATASLPLAIKDTHLRRLFQRLTAYRAWKNSMKSEQDPNYEHAKQFKMSRVSRGCAHLMSGLVVRTLAFSGRFLN